MQLLKQHQLAQARQAGASGVDSLRAWSNYSHEQIEPVLAETRVFSEKVRDICPIVLVVDDDLFMHQLVGRALGSEAYDILFANDDTAALNLLLRSRPDVILMHSVRLPGMDGVSLTQRLKAAPHLASIPVIMMTSDARHETLVKSVATGAVKPSSLP